MSVEQSMDDDQEQGLQSIFPGPPPYWEFFTPDNAEQLQRLRDEAGVKDNQVPPSELAKAVTIPVEAKGSGLEYLLPPPEPAGGVHWTFGQKRSKHPDVPPLEQWTPVLHSDPPSPAELIRLTRAGLLSFLEFVHVMAVNPDAQEYGTRWEHMRHVMLNIYHVLNVYRQWAAREDMIRILEQRVQRARDEIAAIDELETKTNELMARIQKDAKVAAGVGEDKANGDAMEVDTRNGAVQNGQTDVGREDSILLELVEAIVPENEPVPQPTAGD